MTREEAIEYIKSRCIGSTEERDGTQWSEAMWTAIEALADRPIGECRTCGRNADNGGVHEDGRTKCPIQEHYALLLDGYCHLYEPYKGGEEK